MKTSEVNIRDPFILTHEGKYYMYGTRSKTCWGPADGFDCFISEDLENWEGPLEIFQKKDGFFADRSYWAPECYYIHNSFYLVTTFGCESQKKGIYILKAEKPEGPFEIYSECLTPMDWACIDGSLYIEEDIPYLIFSHSFEDTPDGDMCLLELKKNLKESIGEPIKLFSAVEASWAKPVPFAKQEFGMEGDVYFTDGPCVVKLDNERLCMTWSSWSTCGYAVGVAYSDSGKIIGPWKQEEKPLFPENGGHGMVFSGIDGNLKYALHFPNDKYQERPLFKNIMIKNNKIELEN